MVASQQCAIAQLPQELVELIIDEVGSWWDEPAARRTTLQSCTLVSKFWEPRSSFHLFHRVTCVNVCDLSKGLRAMRDIPRLRANVVHFVVSYAAIPLSTYADTLRAFKRLERVDFTPSMQQYVEALDIDWPSPESTGKSLKHLGIKLPPSNPSVLPRILGLFTSVDSLVLTECYVAEGCVPRRSPCLVRHLSVLDCSDEGLLDIPNIVDPSVLSSLRIDLGRFTCHVRMALLNSLLDKLGGNLEEFAYTLSADPWADYGDGV